MTTGQILYLVDGPNGAGKTVALRALTGADGEAVRLRVRDCLFPQLKEPATAFLPQGPQKPIFSRSVSSNLLTPLVYAGHSVLQASDRLSELLDRFSFSYLLKRDYFTLSGGERQFVGLFSVLLRDSPVLILDDPLSMLDQARAKLARSVIANYSSEVRSRRMVVATTADEVYSELSAESALHLGYSPDSRAFVSELEDLLTGLSLPICENQSLRLESVWMKPFGRTLLEETSLELPLNRTYLLTGPNGVGKTCLLKTLAGILRPSRGGLQLLGSRQRNDDPFPGFAVRYYPQQSPGLLGFQNLRDELIFPDSPPWWKTLLSFAFDWRIVDSDSQGSEGSFAELRFRSLLAFLGAAVRSKRVSLALIDEPDASLDPIRLRFVGTLLRWLPNAVGIGLVVSTHRPKVFCETGLHHDPPYAHLRFENRTLRVLAGESQS